MNVKKNKIIDNLAESFINTFNLTIPINTQQLETVINLLNGELNVINSVNYTCVTELYKDGSFIIEIPDNLDNTKVKFKVAQSIGHLVLHSSKFGAVKNESMFSHDSCSTEERYEADKFAETLILPKEQFLDILEKNIDTLGFINIKSMSDYFKVSKSLIIDRCRTLKVI